MKTIKKKKPVSKKTVKKTKKVSSKIHPTAIVDKDAVIADGVEIGAYSIIGPKVKIGSGTKVHHHVIIQGTTTIGKNNTFYSFSSIGGRTQDLKYKGEPTYLEIGDHNTFREFCTVNRSDNAESVTKIGSYNNFLAYCHIAHDCVVGNHCIFSNNGTLAGHVTLGDHVILGGLSAVHQFCRVGSYAMIGGCTKIVQDVPPFFMADGNPAEIRGVNAVGLQRNGFSAEAIKTLKKAYQYLYSTDKNTSQAVQYLEGNIEQTTEVKQLLNFVKSSERGIIR
jgi:UDP-N-acetylglucosamine acyltransferase